MVQRIEPTLEIPGLKKALVKMMCDYNLQVSVQEGCKKILSNDYFNLHERLVRCQQKGIFVDGNIYDFIKVLISKNKNYISICRNLNRFEQRIVHVIKHFKHFNRLHSIRNTLIHLICNNLIKISKLLFII